MADQQEEEYQNPWPDDPMAAAIARSLAAAKPLAKKGKDAKAATQEEPAKEEPKEEEKKREEAVPAKAAAVAAGTGEQKGKEEKLERRRSRSRSRSRSPRRHRSSRRSRSRSRSRSPDRRRRRSRSPHRRSRSRSRSPRSRRHRSRSRSPSRRDRDRGRERDHDRKSSSRRSRSPSRRRRSRTPPPRREHRRTPSPKPAFEDEEFALTAAQISEALCEMFSSNTKKQYPDMFSHTLTLRALDGTVLAAAADVLAHFQKTDGWPCGPALRLFIETEKKGSPTYSIDWYTAGRAPGVGPAGLSPPSARDESVVVVSKAQKGQLAGLWVGADRTGLAADKACTEATAKASPEFQAIMDQLVRPGELQGSDITMHFNNYAIIPTIG